MSKMKIGRAHVLRLLVRVEGKFGILSNERLIRAIALGNDGLVSARNIYMRIGLKVQVELTNQTLRARAQILQIQPHAESQRVFQNGKCGNRNRHGYYSANRWPLSGRDFELQIGRAEAAVRIRDAASHVWRNGRRCVCKARRWGKQGSGPCGCTAK